MKTRKPHRHHQAGLAGWLVAVTIAGLIPAAGQSPRSGMPPHKLPTRLPAVEPAREASTTPRISRRRSIPAIAASTKIHSAQPLPTQQPTATPIEKPTTQRAPVRWLRSSTSSAAAEVSRRLLAQASDDFNVGAWLSAETSAWDALRWAAESVDLQAREQGADASGETAMSRLRRARNAIHEARDFSGKYGEVDAATITRMARSHSTDVLDQVPTEGLTGNDAADRYFDEARVSLASLAARSVEAAQAMDLLATVYLSRAEAETLPSGTALCLRRAALQGQPANANLAARLGMHLADIGLLEEARWALEHCLSIQDSQEAGKALVDVLRRSGKSDQADRLIAELNRSAHGKSISQHATSAAQPKIPQIIELSPSDFAALSKPVIPLSQQSITAASHTKVGPPGTDAAASQAALASARRNINRLVSGDTTREPQPVVSKPEREARPSIARRIMDSFRSVW